MKEGSVLEKILLIPVAAVVFSLIVIAAATIIGSAMYIFLPID